MQLYHFDVDDGQLATDALGSLWPDEEAACRHAVTVATDVAKSNATLLTGGCAVVVFVKNRNGQPVTTVRMVLKIDRALEA